MSKITILLSICAVFLVVCHGVPVCPDEGCPDNDLSSSSSSAKQPLKNGFLLLGGSDYLTTLINVEAYGSDLILPSLPSLPLSLYDHIAEMTESGAIYIAVKYCQEKGKMSEENFDWYENLLEVEEEMLDIEEQEEQDRDTSVLVESDSDTQDEDEEEESSYSSPIHRFGSDTFFPPKIGLVVPDNVDEDIYIYYIYIGLIRYNQSKLKFHLDIQVSYNIEDKAEDEESSENIGNLHDNVGDNDSCFDRVGIPGLVSCDDETDDDEIREDCGRETLGVVKRVNGKGGKEKNEDSTYLVLEKRWMGDALEVDCSSALSTLVIIISILVLELLQTVLVFIALVICSLFGLPSYFESVGIQSSVEGRINGAFGFIRRTSSESSSLHLRTRGDAARPTSRRRIDEVVGLRRMLPLESSNAQLEASWRGGGGVGFRRSSSFQSSTVPQATRGSTEEDLELRRTRTLEGTSNREEAYRSRRRSTGSVSSELGTGENKRRRRMISDSVKKSHGNSENH